MPLEPLWTGSQLLRKLLADFLGGKLTAETFCRDIEAAYNDAIDRSALTQKEQSIFEELFNDVVLFDGDPPQTWEYPGHKTEAQIRAAAFRTVQKLSCL